jgi:hypothetical protein
VIKMENLDMTKYKAYKDFKGLCGFKSLTEKKMSWPKIENKYILENKYMLRPIKEEEIEEIVEVYRVGYPDVYGNPDYEAVLWPETLINKLQSVGGFMKGEHLLIVIEKLDEKKLVGAGGIRMNIGNMSIHWEYGVIHPDYRGKKLFKELVAYLDKISENTGAEYGSMLAVTFHSITQKVIEELGWKTRGIFPGSVLTWNYEDKYYRASPVYFDKFYNKGEDLVPKETELIPKLRAVSDCLRLFNN